jgi:hypothetical protein
MLKNDQPWWRGPHLAMCECCICCIMMQLRRMHLSFHHLDNASLTTMQCHQRCTGSRPASTQPCRHRAACCRNCVTGILAWCFRLTCRLQPSADNKFMLSRIISLSRCGVAVWCLQLLHDLRHPLVPPRRQVPAALRDLLTARHQVQQPTASDVAQCCCVAATHMPCGTYVVNALAMQ